MLGRAGERGGAVLLVAVCAGLLGAIACTPPPRSAEPTGQLEAEIAVALDLLRDLRVYQNRFTPSPAEPAELATVDRQMREFVAKQTAPSVGGEDRQARLEKLRDMLLKVINDNAVEGARRLGLPEPTPTTVETLRSAPKPRK